MIRAKSQTVTFDTHKFVKRLTGAGMDEGIAETLVDGQIDFMNANLASKQDIEQLRANTDTKIAEVKQEIALVRKDIEQLRANTNAKIAETEARLLKWMSGLMVAQGGVVVALIKLL